MARTASSTSSDTTESSSPPTMGGIVKVSTALLSSPSTADAWSPDNPSKVQTAMTISFTSKQFNDNEIELPLREESIETLQYLGFDLPTSQMLIKRYFAEKDPEDSTRHLMKYVHFYIDCTDVFDMDSRDDIFIMRELGLTADFIAPFLNPAHRDVRQTQTLRYWLHETVDIRFETLSMLQKRFHDVVARHSPRDGRWVSIHLEASDHNIPVAVTRVVDQEPAKRAGHVVLYKGTAQRKSQQFIDSDGDTDLTKLNSPRGGDYNNSSEASYWTTDRDTAERFRRWAADRCPYCPTMVIQIQIPEEELSTIHRQDLNFGLPWKLWVWHCRKMTPNELLPKGLHQFRDAGLLTGPILKARDRILYRSRVDELDWNIQDVNTLRVGHAAKQSTQWVFTNDGVINHISSVVRGHTHVSYTLPLAASEGGNSTRMEDGKASQPKRTPFLSYVALVWRLW